LGVELTESLILLFQLRYLKAIIVDFLLELMLLGLELSMRIVQYLNHLLDLVLVLLHLEQSPADVVLLPLQKLLVSLLLMADSRLQQTYLFLVAKIQLLNGC
jgi:hypothetical protein